MKGRGFRMPMHLRQVWNARNGALNPRDLRLYEGCCNGLNETLLCSMFRVCGFRVFWLGCRDQGWRLWWSVQGLIRILAHWDLSYEPESKLLAGGYTGEHYRGYSRGC